MRHSSFDLSFRRTAAATIVAALVLSASLTVSVSVHAGEAEESLASSYALETSGDLPGALRAAQRAAEYNPKQYFARVRVAYLELSVKNYAAAARDYAQAAELAPKALEPILGRQQALIALGKYSEAEPIGREALARDPKNYLANSRLAWTLFNLKNYEAAAKLYNEILTLYPADIEMMLGLGYAELRAGQKRRAAETFRVVLGLVPNHPRATRGLAESR